MDLPGGKCQLKSPPSTYFFVHKKKENQSVPLISLQTHILTWYFSQLRLYMISQILTIDIFLLSMAITHTHMSLGSKISLSLSLSLSKCDNAPILCRHHPFLWSSIFLIAFNKEAYKEFATLWLQRGPLNPQKQVCSVDTPFMPLHL